MNTPLIAAEPTSRGRATSPALLRLAAQERALSRSALQIFSQGDEESLLKIVPALVSSLLQVDQVALFLTAEGEASVMRCRVVGMEDSVRLVLPSEAAPADDFVSAVLRRQAPRQRRSWSPPEPGQECQTALAVPLVVQGQAIGVLIGGRASSERFRDDHVSLLATIGQCIAQALIRILADTRGSDLVLENGASAEHGRLGSDFISIASHEIRTPLTALQGFTELMLSRDVPQNQQREWLSLMNREATRLATLLGELVELGQVESTQAPLRRGFVQMKDIVSQAARLLDCEGKRIQVRSSAVPAMQADGDKLTQVLINLLRNALDYSPVQLPVEVEIARECLARGSALGHTGNASQCLLAHDFNPAVSVAVRDRGGGMTAKELARVFQPFYRATSARERHPDGSGLGLAITQSILDRHQGSLWAQSSSKQGSTVGFCIPAVTSAGNNGAD